MKPYKSIGLFLDSNPGHLYTIGDKTYLAHSCEQSYKIYSLPSLKISLLGPHLAFPLLDIGCHNQSAYIAQKNELLEFEHYHIKNKFVHDCSLIILDEIEKVMVLHPYILLFGGPVFKVVREGHADEGWEHKLPVASQLASVVKINTYVNKILICSQNEVVLMNFVTGKVLYR